MLSLAQIKQSYLSSNAILAARAKAIRSYLLKSIIIVIGLFFYASLLLSVNMGMILYTLIINPQVESDSTATILEIMKEMGIGDYTFLGTIGALAFLAYIVFPPLIGTATLSLVSEDESLSLGLPRGYRFFNSFILNIFSAVSILQLLIGFGLASVFSIEGTRFPTVLAFLFLWLAGAAISTLLGWVRETLILKIGFLKTLLSSLIFLGILGASITYTSLRTTLGQIYGEWMVNISILNWTVILLSFLCLIGLFITAVLVGTNLSNKVASRTFPSENKPSNKKNYLLSKVKGNLAPVMLVVHSAVWRTKEVRRTITIVFLLSFISALYVIPAETSLVGLLIAIPAIISLSWLVNVLGLLGGGVLVLGGDTRKYRILPGAALIYGIGLSMLLSLPILLALLNGGRIDSEAFSEYISVSMLNSVLLPSTAILLAVGKPFRARLEGRGDTLVPPLVSLGYIFIIGSLAMVSGTVILAAEAGLAASSLFLLMAVIIGSTTYFISNYYWVGDKIQYRIMKTINGD